MGVNARTVLLFPMRPSCTKLNNIIIAYAGALGDRAPPPPPPQIF